MTNQNSFKPKGKATSIDEHVGKKIKLRRCLLGLSQSDLADAIDVTFQQVQKYERGVNRVSASKLYELSNTLDVPIDYFYDGLSKKKNTSPSHGVADRETQRLLKYFYSIKDEKLRKSVIQHVKTLSTTSN